MTQKIIRYGTVDSTNPIAMELGHLGEEDGTIVLAEQQTAGSGRRLRQFFSPPGGLYMSVILRPAMPPARLPLITLAAGVACSLVLEKLARLNVRLKWPNDLYIGERKLGGILTEAAPYSAARREIPFVVVGIGVNINTRPESFSPELRNHVISLYDVGRSQYDITSLASAVGEQLTRIVHALGDDQESVCTAWRQRDFLFGREIAWQDPRGRVVQGHGAGLTEDGCYLIRTAGKELLEIVAGDLSFRAREE